MAALNDKFLVFALGKEEYAITIQSVKEIIGIMDITAIPKMPKFMKGVINLRGKIIPVIDLRLKFDLTELSYTERTCIIVVELTLENGTNKMMGIVVDSVSEVLNIFPADIENPPTLEDSTDLSFITGIGKVKGKVAIILDITKVLNISEINKISSLKLGGNENA